MKQRQRRQPLTQTSPFALNRDELPLGAAAADSLAPGSSADDIVTDILRRVCDLIEIPAAVLERIDCDVRADWGGSREYIAKSGETGRRILSERDAYIRREHHQGEREKLLARKFGITIKRIRQIVGRR